MPDQRYGELGAAMTANVITYRGKSAAREVGKALGFDLESLQRLSALVANFEWKGPKDTMAHSFYNAGFDLKHPRIAKYLELYMRIQDLPRHLGQHSGGMVICQGSSIRLCRWNAHRCPVAPSCSGTRKIAPTWASLR
jgi:error-prone DNA polymerase